jgi:hypothetical protein
MRYYFHGDMTEHDPSLAYCARCDLFVNLAHFHDQDQHRGSRSTDRERYAWSRKAYRSYRRDACFAATHTRPDNAPNLFA